MLKGRDKLAEFAERLPLRIGNLANGQLDECQELIEAVEATDHELFLYALLMVRDRLADSPFAAESRARVVLSGGASQLTGIPELATRILSRPVRIGRPLGFARLPAEVPTSTLSPAAAPAAALTIIDQMPTSLRSVACPFGLRSSQGRAHAPPLTLSFRSAQKSAYRTADCVGGWNGSALQLIWSGPGPGH